MRAFEIPERDVRSGRMSRVEVTGELDLATSGAFEAALARGGEDQDHLVADLSECDFIDVGGLAGLLQARQERGVKRMLIGVRGQVKRRLAVAGSSQGERILVQP